MYGELPAALEVTGRVGEHGGVGEASRFASS